VVIWNAAGNIHLAVGRETDRQTDRVAVPYKGRFSRGRTDNFRRSTGLAVTVRIRVFWTSPCYDQLTSLPPLFHIRVANIHLCFSNALISPQGFQSTFARTGSKGVLKKKAMSGLSSGVTYKDVDSGCKLDLFRLQPQNSVALSPRANYTDWSTATCRRNLVPTFADRGVSRGQRGGSPTAVNLRFLDRSRYFSFK
jgi:hypothetical protein